MIYKWYWVLRSPEESEALQRQLFSLGVTWPSGSTTIKSKQHKYIVLTTMGGYAHIKHSRTGDFREYHGPDEIKKMTLIDAWVNEELIKRIRDEKQR